MPRSIAPLLAQRASRQLDDLSKQYDALSHRDKIGALILAQRSIRSLGKRVSDDVAGAEHSAKDRIAAYFEANAGRVIEGEELAVVAGIAEYGRRIRELRSQGLDIISGNDGGKEGATSLRPNQYMLRGKAKPVTRKSHR